MTAGQTLYEVDHVLLGVRDLDEGIAFMSQRTGIVPAIGGNHPGQGTRNALLSLGSRQYFEIIAPDPEQKEQDQGWVTMVRNLPQPKLITWAATTTDIESAGKRIRDAGYGSAGIIPGSRTRPDGKILRWRTLAVGAIQAGIVPFLIDWHADSIHPSGDSPGGCRLLDFRLEHPDPDAINAMLNVLGLHIRAARAPEAALRARLATPNGPIEIP